MDDLQLTDRVADRGAVIETEPCFEVTGGGVIYLATHQLASAPEDPQDAA